jgi:TonB family protein
METRRRVLLASLIALGACGLESPSGPLPNTPVVDVMNAGYSGKAGFIAYSVPPVMQNGPVVWAALELEYAALREAGLRGRTVVGARLDETGVVQNVRVDESSGLPILDDVALRVARHIQFSPAMTKTRAVPVQVSIPFRFTGK